MKKALLLSLGAVALSLASKATIHEVQVANYQFIPSNITNVLVGDTVRFTWVSGNHTTTDDPANQAAGNAVPAGAAPWDKPINSGNPTYDYPVTVAGLYNYYCIPHKDFGMVGQFTASESLPVKLSSFLAGGSNGKVLLNWKTLTEDNTDHFSIRRSVNGSEFTEIAKLPAAGHSGAERSYSYIDGSISSQQKYYYYNLAIVDKDGRQVFSDTKLFNNAKATTKLILSLSPNPISKPGHLMMSFNAEKEGKMEVQLIDAGGKIIMQTTMQASAGVNNGHIHMGDLPSGTYSLICTMDGIKETHRLVYK